MVLGSIPMESAPNRCMGIVGQPSSGEPADEREHFYICNVCGQAVDYRQLGQVFHHEQRDHERLEFDA